MALEIGITKKNEQIVTKDKTASHLGSGTVSVFATPSMILLMERTSHECVAPFLEPGQSTVGTAVNIRHLSATPEGKKVWCESKLIEIDRKKLVFEVNAFDEKGQIGTGTHERFIIDINKFMEKANKDM